MCSQSEKGNLNPKQANTEPEAVKLFADSRGMKMPANVNHCITVDKKANLVTKQKILVVR